MLEGGAGTDLADYSPRTNPVEADLHGDADDGGKGENDVIASDIEGLRGGAGADRLTGSPGANRLFGGEGGDQLDGRGGGDRISGEGGDDTLLGGLGRDRLDAGLGEDRVGARDGAKDRVACGGGRDTIDGDRADARSSCERRGAVRIRSRPASVFLVPRRA